MVTQNTQIDKRVQPLLQDITAWRHELHQYPELEFDVHRTAEFVAEKLRSFGVDDVVEGIGKTGVGGVIKGEKNDSGMVVGLRADMDALPIIEDTQLQYASKIDGKMHACGHDGHTAMLLGAAKVLADSRSFNGTVVVIFQPAEEGGGGGREMVNDGLMERFNINQVFGMHNMPNMPLGYFGVRAGPIMAAADIFHVTIEGVGGHAAMPQYAIDTTLVTSQIILSLQSIASRNVDPMESVVVSVTSVHSDGDSYNVIPQTVTIKGTVRTLNAAIQDHAEKRFHEIVEHTAKAMGATVKLVYTRDYPCTVNSVEEAGFAGRVASQVVGSDQVDVDITPMMGAEDFSFMLNARPGAFIFVGNGESASLHHPQYDFNDDAIPYGCSYWTSIVETAMPL
jgi:hippurate hydrolase